MDPDWNIIEDYTNKVQGDWPWTVWDRIIAREKGQQGTFDGRDFETIAAALYRTMPPPDVDAAWCRIVARERARMGLPDLDTERSAAVLFLAEVGTATVDDLVREGVYANRNTATVVLGSLAKQGRIRRVSAGVYAWRGGA